MKTLSRWLRPPQGMTVSVVGSILIFGFSLVGCGPTPGQSGGFSSVHLDASRALVYGATEGPGALTAAFDVAVSPQGQILVSEPTLAEISVFDSEGGFLQTIGRRGEGPGEFRTPGAIRFKGDTLTVLDFMSGINLFTSDGEFIDRVSFTLPTPPELGFPTRPALLLADGSVACLAPLRSILIVNGEVTHESWVKADRSGTLVDTLVKYPVDGRYSSFGLPEGPPYVGPPATPWDDILAMPPDGSELVMVKRSAALLGTDPVVRLFRIDLSGDTLFSRSLRYDPKPITTEWRDSVSYSWAEPEGDRRSLTVDRLAGIYLEEMDWPAHHPAVSEVVAGTDGTVWMKRETPIGDSIRWDMVDSDFEPLGFTFLPNDFAVKRVSRSAVWGVELDEWDIPWVVRYDVQSRD